MWRHRIVEPDGYAAFEKAEDEELLEDITLWCRRCDRLWSNGASVAEARTFADNHDRHCHSAEPVADPTIVKATPPILTTDNEPSEPAFVPALAVETRTSEEEDSDRMSWRDQAACLGFHVDVFLPIGEGRKRTKTTIAKLICASCPVQSECLSYALATDQIIGVWGGTTPKERQRLHKLDEVTHP